MHRAAPRVSLRSLFKVRAEFRADEFRWNNSWFTRSVIPWSWLCQDQIWCVLLYSELQKYRNLNNVNLVCQYLVMKQRVVESSRFVKTHQVDGQSRALVASGGKAWRGRCGGTPERLAWPRTVPRHWWDRRGETGESLARRETRTTADCVLRDLHW